MYQTKSCRENDNPHFMCSNYISENCAIYWIMWKNYGTARQATDNNKAHAHCMLDK